MIEFTMDKFSGPLGLLLSMIEGEEMDITEVNLAKIADEYVNYIRATENIDPEEMADFLVVAAKLLFIKSKALLPYLYSEEVKEDVDDLEKQLKMYKEFVAASLKIKNIIADKNFLFLPPLIKNRRQHFNLPVFSAPQKVNTKVLHDEYVRIIMALEKKKEEKLPERTLEAKINIEDKILAIKKMLLDRIRVSFSKLLNSSTTRTEVIVNFLAALELAKQNELIFEQDELFSEIHIRRQV